ncbi:phage filamentation protein Fil family protein [Pectobacterium odoriferum]|uniref:phage filamentation protein Fil family protein n=1 Tax=Pectobacterium odoriferum TaxID=78398 RepID=UPI0032EAC604
MISIARLLTQQSPSPQLASGKGWLELPSGQRVQPTPAQAYFAPWSKKTVCACNAAPLVLASPDWG